MIYAHEIVINGRRVATDAPVYFIADIAANHDGDLQRAKDLIWRAKEAGADCAKFQHFLADKIVSDYGFKSLKTAQSHQQSWQKSVFDIYRDYECQRGWTEELVATAKSAEIEFMTTPYDIDAVESLNGFVNAYKVGSGDITWIEFIEYIAQQHKPVFLACGASDLSDVKRAVAAVLQYNSSIVLMQCNTNYTADMANFKYINLNVLKSFRQIYPDMLLGLSDHTLGHATVLGAVALGARVIEKHFTDDNSRTGPDHKFAMNPLSWADMVERCRELELALGDGVKRVEGNEQDTVVIQRRSIRLKRSMMAGEIVTANDAEALRPAPLGAIPPYKLAEIIGKKLNRAKDKGDCIYPEDLMI